MKNSPKSFSSTFRMAESSEPSRTQLPATSHSAIPFCRISFFFSSTVSGSGFPKISAIIGQNAFLG